MNESSSVDSGYPSLLTLPTVRQAIIICPLCILAIIGIYWAKPTEGNTVFGLAFLTGIVQAFAALFLVMAVRAAKSIREEMDSRHTIRKVQVSDSQLMEEAFRLGRYAAIDTKPNPEHVPEWAEYVRIILEGTLHQIESTRVIRPDQREAVIREFQRGVETLVACQSNGDNTFALTNTAICQMVGRIFQEIRAGS